MGRGGLEGRCGRVGWKVGEEGRKNGGGRMVGERYILKCSLGSLARLSTLS